MKHIAQNLPDRGIFLDGLSLTFKGIPRNVSDETNFIMEIARAFGGGYEFRAVGGKGYPLTALIKGKHIVDNTDWLIYCAYGSSNRGQHINIECKGSMTKDFIEFVNMSGVEWSLTRADITLDLIMDFDEGHKICQDYAIKKNIGTNLVGDWEGKERGRTYYIGASRKECESYIRFYEKSIELRQQGYKDVPDNIQRLELEYKPKKPKRQHITSLVAEDILSTALNPLELFQSFHDLGLEPYRISSKKDRDYKRSVRYMLSQYLAYIKEWDDEEGLGSLFDEIQYAVAKGHVAMG